LLDLLQTGELLRDELECAVQQYDVQHGQGPSESWVETI
jgi:hypothetical protein